MIKFDAPSEELLEELRTKHGEVIEVEESDRVFLVVKPANARAAMMRFTATAGNDAKKFESFEALTKASVVHPPKDTLKAILDDEPGLVFTLGERALDLLGVRQASAKKG